MKKIIASAVGLMLVGGVAVTTASAVESQFGGYWRTRIYFQDNMTETQSNGDTNFNMIDTRTRLYYTAKFSDNFKFVNKFEFNNNWGDNVGGDIATDGTGIFRIKNSYADFTLGKVNTKVGLQGGVNIARGFVFGDDFAGAVVTADFGMVKVPVAYIAASIEDNGAKAASVHLAVDSVGGGGDFGAGSGDVHILSVLPTIKINDMVSITPNATWLTVTHEDTDVYWLGVDVDLKFDAVKAGLTGIYNGGSIDKINTGDTSDSDISAFLLAAQVDAGIVHGQAFYASGDEENKTNNDVDGFVTIGTPYASGTYYNWAEILGMGIFDNTAPSASMGDHISNVWAVNAGVTVKPMDKLTLNFDAWYAQLAEKRDVSTTATPKMEDDLGLELDAKLTYALMDNLNADVVFAYLVAGDATGPDDIMEGGVRLSLSF
jgi:hypothetical protein